MELYDLIVIGAGPGGYLPALRAAKAGKRVAVVDKSHLGGTCLNCGCIPTKTYLHTAGLCREAGQASAAGLAADGLNVDMKVLKARKDQVVEELRSGISKQFQMNHVDFYSGTACITAPHVVLVRAEKETELSAAYILIAAGSEPLIPPILGADLPGVDTSTSLLDRDKRYDHLLIIGGGVIGMEFATIYSDLGCKVTVLEAMDRILPGMDKEISQNLKMILKKRGVEIHTGARVRGVEKRSDGFACTYTEKDQDMMVAADGVLLAIGRKMAGERLFIEALRAQIFFDRGKIVVDERFRTAIPHIYAVGDIIGGVQLAHAATAEGYMAVADMFAGLPEKTLSIIPGCVYTDPEIACAGMTEEEAKKAGIETRVCKYLMSTNGKSVLTMQERGFIKLVARADTGTLIGAQLMCARATDMIGTLILAIVQKMTMEQVAFIVLPHPTFCEGIGEAAEAYLLK